MAVCCCAPRSPIRTVDGKAVGAVVVSRYLGAALDKEARRVTAADERYPGLRYLQTPILASTSSFLPAVTLLDPDRRHVARAVSRQADHAAGAAIGGRRARHWRRRSGRAPPGRDRGRTRLAGRSVQHDGGGAADQPRRRSKSPARISRAQEPEVEARAGTSRRSSSAWRLASFPLDADADRHRERRRRTAAGARIGSAVGQSARGCSPCRYLTAAAGHSSMATEPASRGAPSRRSPSRARAVR